MPSVPHSMLAFSHLIAVESSSLAALGYDDLRSILQVQFVDGSIYEYTDVPGLVYHNFRRSDSKGAYFNRHIRRQYRHRRLRSPFLID